MENYFEIEGYKFDNNITDIITALEFKTTLTGFECGFDLCANKDTLIIYGKNICEGTECQITGKQECDENEKYVGNFHTHPAGNVASYADIMNAYAHSILIVSGDKLLLYIRTIKQNQESYDLIYEYYNKYKNYEIKHGQLNKELLEEKALIRKTIIETAFDVIELKL